MEHRFGLSNQSILRWVWEKVKSLMVSMAIGVPVALVFYYFLKSAGVNWWIYFSIFVVFVTVILARLAPVLIFPLFYKFKEIEDGEIKGRIEQVLSDAGVSIKGIYSFNMSRDTKKANAGFTGLGKTKRIILSDTLLQEFNSRVRFPVREVQLREFIHRRDEGFPVRCFLHSVFIRLENVS